ncbi:hypothetical protein FACS1894208_06470 [Clostridia bacterium]|nr:hypothetical protein FACS1894208_06470 [Clostridia bacterium]
MAVISRRKSVKDKVSFSIRLDPKLKKAIEAMAYAKKLSMGMLIEEVLALTIESEKPSDLFTEHRDSA